MNYIYDVFLAYHGTYDSNGSYSKAVEIESYLKEHGYKPYIFKETSGESWSSTLRHIQESRCMLVVFTDSILTDNYGRISSIRIKEKHVEPYQLYEEIEQFRSLVNTGVKHLQKINFAYFGDLSNESARQFCLKVFSDICPKLNNILAAENSMNDINKWLDEAIKLPEGDLYDDYYTDLEFTISDIVDNLIKRNCAIVLGPLINDNYRLYARDEKNFFEKCKKTLQYEGKSALLKDIENFKRYNIHKNIVNVAKLPFSTYITTVEYTQISQALNSINKECKVLRDGNSIHSLDLQRGEIPIFELERSEIWNDDCKIPVGFVSDIIKMVLTGRKIVYLGYDEEYRGYIQIVETVKQILGDDFTGANNNIVIVDGFKKNINRKHMDYKILSMSTEDFLGRLITNKSFNKSFRYTAEDSKFITDLFNIASTPTETQAIELFLKQILEDIKVLSFEEIIKKADSNCTNLKKIKRNFNAFEKCWKDIKSQILENEQMSNNNSLKDIIEEIQYKRKCISRGILKAGKIFSKETSGGSILLYSQSLRVVEFLKGLSSQYQNNSNLYVCECRPKSDIPFRDAQNMCDMLIDSKCDFRSMTIIPDMAAFNLIERSLINHVVIGAHDVVFFNGNPLYFINTCGTSALVEMAKNQNIPVLVVAEKAKFNELYIETSENQSVNYEISYGQESTIYDDYDFIQWSETNNVNTRNIGYDFCRFYSGMKLVCESKIIDCENSEVSIVLIDKTKGE